MQRQQDPCSPANLLTHRASEPSCGRFSAVFAKGYASWGAPRNREHIENIRKPVWILLDLFGID